MAGCWNVKRMYICIYMYIYKECICEFIIGSAVHCTNVLTSLQAQYGGLWRPNSGLESVCVSTQKVRLSQRILMVCERTVETLHLPKNLEHLVPVRRSPWGSLYAPVSTCATRLRQPTYPHVLGLELTRDSESPPTCWVRMFGPHVWERCSPGHWRRPYQHASRWDGYI